MKKIISILIGLVLMFSMVPLVLADEGTYSGSNYETRTEARTEIQEKMQEHKAEIKDKMENGQMVVHMNKGVGGNGLENALQRCVASGQDENHCKEVLERVMKMQEEHKDRVKSLLAGEGFSKFAHGEAREVMKAKHDELEGKFKEHHEMAMKLRDEIKEQRSKLEGFKELFDQCQTNPTDECKAKIAEKITALKDFVGKVDSLANTEIEKLGDKLGASQDLTADEVQEIQGKMDSAKQELENAKTKIDALTADSTKDQIKEALSSFREVFGKLKQSIRGEAEGLVHARIGGIIVKSEHLRDKLSDVLSRLAEKGVDTSATESLVTGFDEHLKLAADLYEQAQAKFKEARETKSEELYKEAINLVQQAKEHTQEAHEALKDIFSNLKEHKEEKAVTTVEPEEDDNDNNDKEENEGEPGAAVATQ